MSVGTKLTESNARAYLLLQLSAIDIVLQRAIERWGTIEDMHPQRTRKKDSCSLSGGPIFQ